MSSKPSDWFVGVTDLFAIILPGAILTAALTDLVQDAIFGPVFPVLRTSAQRWAAFFVAAFVLGHIIFGVASALDPVYDWFRRRMVPPHRDHTYQRAKALMETELTPAHTNITGVFRWSRTTIQLRNPAAAAEVHRFEAISKFFRSFVVVLLVLSVFLAVENEIVGVAVSLALAVAAFWQFGENRWKATQQAYQYYIACSLAGNRAAEKEPTAPALT